ncbi:1,4-alpha-glucan branching enzyme GlgB [Streptococcus oralis subsp. tigurinus]|uniref:1,4-alpha-glucan branching enzyme GlgB n=1 Tax=Streptococcus oralis subsp. tigurinus TaxID=1077464 RepID=A0A223ZU31_STROR|nr:1,4-alpha-glucan branching enzyme GlgB [Streptococcus oralis subsp. tigurinus]
MIKNGCFGIIIKKYMEIVSCSISGYIIFKMLGNFLKTFIKKYDFLRKLLESYLKRVYNGIIENAYKRKGIE